MIEVENLTKTYNPHSRNANTVLDNASITLPDKGLVFIVGQSGIGKSTILNAVGGLTSYEGKILYDHKEEDIEKYRRKNISYIFQDFMLFNDLSVRDNIKIALNIQGIYDEEEITRRVAILLKAIHLDINPKRRTSALSLGQRQRVAIARALASNPKVILADEPTGNLDSQTSITIMGLLKNISRDRLVLVVTHNMNIVKLYADEAYSIINKKFQKMDVEAAQREQKGDRDFSKNKIYLDEMKEEDFASESTIIKLYTKEEETDKKNEIRIINDNGRILIIGDNVTLIQPDQVVTTHKDEEAKEEHNLSEEPINVSFEERNEKRKFRDSPFAQFFRERFSYTRSDQPKRKFGYILAKFLEVLVPLIAFVFMDVFGYLYKNFADPDLMSGHNPDNTVVLAWKKDVKKTDSLSLFEKIIDDNNGIDYLPTEMPNEQSDYKTTISEYHFDAADSLVDTDAAKAVNHSTAKTGLTFLSVDRIKDMSHFSALKKYDLRDDELVLDFSYLQGLSTSGHLSYDYSGYDYSSYHTKDGKLFKDSLVGSLFRIPDTTALGNTYKEKVYRIVGVETLGYNAMYCNENTYLGFAKTHRNVSSDYSSYYLPLPDLSQYTILDYDTMPKDDYEIYSNMDASLIRGVNPFTDGNLIVSENCQYDFYKIKDTKYVYPTDSIYNIRNKNNPDEKILCFLDKTVKAQFLSFYIVNTAVTNNTVDDNDSNLTAKLEDDSASVNISIPSSLKDYDESYFTENPVYKSLLSYNDIPLTINVVSTFESASTNTVRVSSQGRKYLSKLYFGNMHIYKMDYGTPQEASSWQNLAYSTGFITSDIGKTKEYFRSNPDLGIDCFSIREAANKYISAYQSGVVTFLTIILLILTAILILIQVLDNIARINRNKMEYGILRCLGKSRKEIIWDDSMLIVANTIVNQYILILVIVLILLVFNLYFMGVYLIPFLLGLMLVNLLSSIIPLSITLAKKPIDILRNIQ